MNCLVCANEIQDVFYTTIDSHGNVDTLCYRCYQTSALDNYQDMKDGGGTKVVLDKCECGTKAPIGQGHSSWCQKYRKEF
jgi:hypothetical protein